MKKSLTILIITFLLHSCSDNHTEGSLLEEDRGIAYIENEAGEKIAFNGKAIWDLENGNKRIISYVEGVRQTLEEGIEGDNGFSGLKVNYVRNEENYLNSRIKGKGIKQNAILSKANFKNDLLDGECIDFPTKWWMPEKITSYGYKVITNFKEGKREGNSYAITKKDALYKSSLTRFGDEGESQNRKDFFNKLKRNNTSGVNKVIDKPFIVSSLGWREGKLHGESISHNLSSTTTPGTMVYKGNFENGCPIGTHTFYADGDYLEIDDSDYSRTPYRVHLAYDLEKNLDGKQYEIEFKDCKESIERRYALNNGTKWVNKNSIISEIYYDDKGFVTKIFECNFSGTECETVNYYEGMPCDNEGNVSCDELKGGMYEADTSLQKLERKYAAGSLSCSSKDISTADKIKWGIVGSGGKSKSVCQALMRTNQRRYELDDVDYSESFIRPYRSFCSN